jgi:hypothetical protein
LSTSRALIKFEVRDLLYSLMKSCFYSWFEKKEEFCNYFCWVLTKKVYHVEIILSIIKKNILKILTIMAGSCIISWLNLAIKKRQ